MKHISREALARYLIEADSEEDRIVVDWHLEYCPICREQITERDIMRIAREARERLVAAVRSAERN